MPTCHPCAIQALAWVRVALPRGPSATSHPRRSRAKINPLFNLFLIVLINLKSKINLEKSQKIPKN